MNVEMLMKLYPSIKEKSVIGRLTTYEQVCKLLHRHEKAVSFIGLSEQNRKIHDLTLGNGEVKFLLWSQMHGNEPTATAAIIDIVNFLTSENEDIKKISTLILSKFTIKFIPMLNPDGATLWQRNNALDIDLNRDAVALKASESRILRAIRDKYSPNYCFNLHDQRNIFNVKNTEKPATISFLSPSVDAQRTINPTRVKAMELICAMNNAVNKVINGYVSRFTDEFYPTATGDNFQKDGFPTILIESGAFPDDDERQMARMMNFVSILSAINYILEEKNEYSVGDYEKIPLNDIELCDVLLKDVGFQTCICDVALLYHDFPDENRTSMDRKTVVYKVGNLKEYYGLKIIDAGGLSLDFLGKEPPVIGEVINYK